jgi:GDP-L-fucose synthase
LPALIRKFILAKMLQDNDYASVKKDLLLSNDISHDMEHDEIDIFLTNLGIEKNSISLWGSGNAYREFLHADDCADAVVYFMNNIDAEQAGICINIGTGIDCSIKEVAELIANKVDYKGDILFDKNKPDGTPKKLLCVDKAKSLGWQSAISLEKGIESVIMHYQHSVQNNLALRY